MPLLADAIQPLIMPALGKVRGEKSNSLTLADLIVAPAAAYDFNISNADKAVLLDFRDPMVLAVAVASDSGRLSSAAFQTTSTIVDEIIARDSAAWGLVKLYYAAFYAGHALIRLCGEGCSYFGRQHATRLLSISDALGMSPLFRIEAGLYRCVVTNSGTALTCVRTHSSAGGTHQIFWTLFGNYLKRAAEGALKGHMTRADAQAAFVQFDQLLTMLSRGAGYSWLSTVRNDLQYRLQHGVWHPERLRAPALRGLSSLAGQWKRDPMSIDFANCKFGLLGEFVCCCVFVIALCREILWHIAERSSVGARSFARTGPMVLLNNIGVTP